MAVPCELAVGLKPQVAQTFVIKPASGTLRKHVENWAQLQVMDKRVSSYALVQLEERDELFLVLTKPEAIRVEYAKFEFLERCGRFIVPIEVTWVRPLTRRLQRLFGWGDVCATEADIARACKAGDAEELKAILPQAVAVAPQFFGKAPNTQAASSSSSQLVAEDQDISLALLPKVLTALRSGLPPLEDCRHEFWQEVNKVRGPCARGAPAVTYAPNGTVKSCAHYGPYTRCIKCNLVLCNKCAAADEDDAGDRRELEKAVRRARAQQPPPYWQHPARPLPFYVIDHAKWPDDEKLPWIKQEVGEGVDLPTFAQAFLDLFGGKLRGAVQQKTKVLQLYARYAPESPEAAWKKESDLPPEDLECFQRVWNPDAPSRCWECGKALVGPMPFGRHYCNEACRAADKTHACSKCKSAANVVNTEGYYRCTACDKHPGLGKRGKRKTTETTHAGLAAVAAFDERLDRQREMSKMASRIWGMDCAPNPNHEPAWKRPRRS